MNQLILAEGVGSLQTIGCGAECLLVPLDSEAGEVLPDKLLMHEHGSTSSHEVRRRWKDWVCFLSKRQNRT